MSKKFSNAQQHYQTQEHETIAVLEALMKWEDKLLGCKFTLVTDHKGLEYFETQKNLSDRQVRWWEFLSCFNYTIMHVNGIDNKVADCLSHYYENDMEASARTLGEPPRNQRTIDSGRPTTAPSTRLNQPQKGTMVRSLPHD